jgi:hypothetical protein
MHVLLGMRKSATQVGLSVLPIYWALSHGTLADEQSHTLGTLGILAESQVAIQVHAP